MKKKILHIKKSLVLGMVFFALAGCTLHPAPASDDTETQVSDDEDTEKDSTDQDGDPVQVPGDDKIAYADEETAILVRYSSSNPIYIADSEGNITGCYDREEMSAKLSESEREIYKLYDGESGQGSTLLGEGGGFLYFTCNYLNKSENRYEVLVFAVSEEGYDFYPITTFPSSLIYGTDYYNDRLYIDISLGYDDSRYLGVAEKVYSFNEASGSFEEERSDVADLLEELNDIGMTVYGPKCDEWLGARCYTRALDECGYLIGYDHNGYVMVNSKGMSLPLPEEITSYNCFFTGKYIYYCVNDYDLGITTAYVYDVENNVSNQICEEMRSVNFLGEDSGAVYYSTRSQGEEYGICHNYIYRHDPKSGESRLMYDSVYIPGSGLTPGIEGFRVLNGKIYILNFNDGDIRWEMADVSEDAVSFEDIGCREERINAFDFGTISYESTEMSCEKCGTVLEQKYIEYLVLDQGFSEYANSINDALVAHCRYITGMNYTSDGTGIYDSPCESHMAEPSWYRVTDDVTVGEVDIIDDRYLAVSMGGYWYSGGAHGMPSRNQYLFDLKTGEELTFKDFYKGSAEDFRILVAEKTVEDYLSYGDYSPYFDQDKAEIYEDAYSYADIGQTCIEFTDEGIIYYYPPYVMAPYAAGFMEIFIPYSDVFGRDTLAE